jgi:hypothetical protein
MVIAFVLERQEVRFASPYVGVSRFNREEYRSLSFSRSSRKPPAMPSLHSFHIVATRLGYRLSDIEQ